MAVLEYLGLTKVRVKVKGKFISRKINVLRWRPEKNSNLGIPVDTFACGSYDDPRNLLSLWKLPSDETKDVKQLSSIPHLDGDVNDIKFVNENTLVAAASLGNVSLYKINEENNSLAKAFTWEKLHYINEGKLKSSCFSIDTMDEDMLSVGADGKLNILSVNSCDKPLRVIEADSSPIMCVCFIKHNECLTASMRGQLKLWDLRQAGNDPVSTIYLTKTNTHSGPKGYPETKHPVATSVTRHPTQCHIVGSGGDDGCVSVWDLRDCSHPTTVFDPQIAAVRGVSFNPLHPDHLFSCTDKGYLWHFDCSYQPGANPFDSTSSPIDASSLHTASMSKHRTAMESIMPNVDASVNCLDVSGENIICGTDNETLFVCRMEFY